MISIKFAQRKHAQLIVDFIHMLAYYEKKAAEVVVTRQDIENYIFDKGIAEAVIAYFNNKEAGFAVFYPRFSTFAGKSGLYIEDLFVKPEYRHKKIGKSLMSFLANQAVSRGYKNLEFSVLDWNQQAINFYHRLGATRKDEWLNYNIEGKDLRSLAQTSFPLP